METIHDKNILFLRDLIEKENFDWLNSNQPVSFEFFKSGGGTHLYLMENADKKFVARINYYEPKNEWGIKKQEFTVLKLIEPLHISPKVFYFSDNNSLKQDLTIVEYIEGETMGAVSDENVLALAVDLHKLHTSFPFERAGDTIPPNNELPYKCNIYNEFANGEDKKIEKHLSLDGIDKVVEPYNRINKKLGEWFNNLPIFEELTEFCLCHADIKKENILVTEKGIMFIDWECAGSDIPETDIGRLFSGCEFSNKQQEVFLKEYYGAMPDKLILQRIKAIKQTLDFFSCLRRLHYNKTKKLECRPYVG